MRTMCWLLASVFLLCGAGASSAQDAPAPAAPTPIPLGQAVPRAESAADHLRALNADLSRDTTVARLEAKLPKFSLQTGVYADESFHILSSDPSLHTLRRLGRAWGIFGDYLASWKDEAERREKALADRAPALERFEKNWEATLSALTAQGAPPEVLQRIRTVIATIQATRERLQQEQARLLAVEERLSQLDLRIGDAAAAVEAAQDRTVSLLLVRDQPPVWKLDARQTFRVGEEEGGDSWSAQFASLFGYVEWQRDKLVAHGIVTLLFLGFLYWVRRRAHAWAGKNPGFQLAAGIFDRPIAATLLLSLLVTEGVYPLAPRLFWIAASTAALVPAVLILRSLVARRLVPILDALIFFYLFDQARAAAAILPVLSRFIFLGEMAAILLFLGGLLVRARKSPGEGEGDFLGRAIRVGGRLAAAVVAAGGLANALGYVELGDLLGGGALHAAYLAVGFNAALRILDGLAATACHLPPLSRSTAVRDHHALMSRRLHRILFWVAAAIWLCVVLEAFALRAPVFDAGRKVLATTLHTGAWKAAPAAAPGAPAASSLPHAHGITVGDLLAFGLTVWAAFLLSRFIRFILEHDVYPRLRLSHGLPYAISTMLHYAILVVAFVSATAALGVDMTKFTILVSAFGVGIGFGMQNIINNFVSGIILLFERPIKVGDSIQVDEAIGTVERIGIRASVLRTTNGSEIIVPNGTLISDRVTNWTLSRRSRMVVIPFNVSRGPDPAHVMEIAAAAAVRHPEIEKIPAPSVQLTALGATLGFELRVWTGRVDDWTRVRSELMVEIGSALAKENIAIS